MRFTVTVTFDIEADSYDEAVEQIRALEEASVLTIDLQDIDHTDLH